MYIGYIIMANGSHLFTVMLSVVLLIVMAPKKSETHEVLSMKYLVVPLCSNIVSSPLCDTPLLLQSVYCDQ
jgi:hypothetical protein